MKGAYFLSQRTRPHEGAGQEVYFLLNAIKLELVTLLVWDQIEGADRGQSDFPNTNCFGTCVQLAENGGDEHASPR